MSSPGCPYDNAAMENFFGTLKTECLYLALFNQEATERLESIIQAMKVAQGITEEIKGRDQMAWVGAMNNIRACAEEIVYAELVYA